jgi:hypothetical protein
MPSLRNTNVEAVIRFECPHSRLPDCFVTPHANPDEVSYLTAASGSAAGSDGDTSGRTTTSTRGRGWCDGVSFLENGLILYSPTPYSRRENFTLAHEAAHWLVNRDDDAVDWIADHPNSKGILEQLCDHIAGQLLIPDETVTTVLGDQPVRAEHIRALYDATNASEPACAIALARRISGVAASVIIEMPSRMVTYSSLVWDGFDGRPLAYPWPGQHVPNGHLLRTLSADSTRTTRSWWSTPWNERHSYYLDATSNSCRIYAIFSEHDLWGVEALHLDVAEHRPGRPTRQLTCSCGFKGAVTGYPHEDCNEPFCPQCESCGCQRKIARHRPCSKCFVLTPPAALEDGVCSECR